MKLLLLKLEAAVKKVADDITHPRPDNDEVNEIQVVLNMNDKPQSIRQMKVELLIT